MDIFEALKKRRSIREYRAEPVPREALQQLVDAARFAPTARGVQPWEFVVIARQETLQKIAGISDHGKFIGRAAACIAVFSQDTRYYLEDCCAATQNIMLAATALGIGSCWVAGDKKPYCPDIAGLLRVPSAYKLVSLIALGYPLSPQSFRETDKRPLAELLHWEAF